MNTLQKIVATVTIAASTVASAGVSAQAGDWNRPGYGHGGNRAHYAPSPRQNYAHQQHGHRDNRGNKIATGVAIGLGAVILGSILAAEANRNNRDSGY